MNRLKQEEIQISIGSAGLDQLLVKLADYRQMQKTADCEKEFHVLLGTQLGIADALYLLGYMSYEDHTKLGQFINSEDYER